MADPFAALGGGGSSTPTTAGSTTATPTKTGTVAPPASTQTSLSTSSSNPMPGGLAPGAPGVNRLTNFQETLTISGGGPANIMMPNILGAWQRQQTYPLMPGKATQQGTATGTTGWPPVPPPIWPDFLKGTPIIKYTSPTRNGNTLTDYIVNWTYEFEAPGPFQGTPHLWPK